MADPLIAMLRELGVASESIKVESFISPSRLNAGDASPNVEAPFPAMDDESDAVATLEFVRSGKRVVDLAGKTILEIAEDQGVDIPYDCRSGICGQCKTRLLSGTVVMEAEDALNPADRANGVILSCQARCRGDVVIDA